MKNFCKKQTFFVLLETRHCCTGMYVYVNLDFKRVNVEYACGTLNYEGDDTSSRTRGIHTISPSSEYAYVFSNHQLD